MDKITSKSSVRPELTGVYFARDKMVATDSFRLIEVKKEIGLEGEPRVIKAKGFRGKDKFITISADNIIKDGDKLMQGEATGGDFPEYEKVFEGLSDAPRFSMVLNAKYLAELAAEVDAQAGNAFHKVRLDFFESKRPLLIAAEGENVSVRGLLSPMTG